MMQEQTRTVWKRIFGIGLLLLCLFAVAVLYFAEPEKSTVDVCTVHILTGLDCPGCGMTRAFHCLLHLELAEALDYNIFSPVLFLLLATVLGGVCYQLITGKRIRGNIPLWPFMVLVVLMLVFGIVRNLPFEPFTYLHT